VSPTKRGQISRGSFNSGLQRVFLRIVGVGHEKKEWRKGRRERVSVIGGNTSSREETKKSERGDGLSESGS